MRTRNFSAGPSVLPVEVLKELQDQLFDYEGNGLSMIEASHRDKMFDKLYVETQNLFRELLNIPENYDVYFLGGGATLQFGMIPANFLMPGTVADYAKTGTWTSKAINDAKIMGDVNVFFDSKTSMPRPEDVVPSKNSSYVYLCSNETIGGTEVRDFPRLKDVPLICDMSSDIFSRPFDVTKFGMVYGGVQKNLGPAGATFIIMRKDMLDRKNTKLPAYLDYSSQAKEPGLYNTPPVFSIWGVKLVLDWIKAKGGVAAMDKAADEKSNLLYNLFDSSEFFSTPVEKEFRSRMNVVFRLPSEELEAQFLKEAAAVPMLGLKGHRSVGGLRASIYNAMPKEHVEDLVSLLKDFERRNG